MRMTGSGQRKSHSAYSDLSGHNQPGGHRRTHKLGGIILLALLLILIGPTSSTIATPTANFAAPVAATQKKERTVYVTRTGEKYHRGDCRYLRQSKIAIKLSEARRQGYTPCKVCRP